MVAIIVLLVSILLPSLRMVREAGRRSVCLTNLHHVAEAQQFYAHDNNQRSTRIVWPEVGQRAAEYGNIAWSLDAEYPVDTLGPVGVGLLVTGGYAPEDGHMFYCPSQTDWSCQYDNPFIGWAYFGEAVVEIFPQFGEEGPWVSTALFTRKTQELDGNIRALTGDMWYGRRWQTCHDAEGINVVYTDGSVQWLAGAGAMLDGCTDDEAGVESGWRLLDRQH